MEPLLYFSSDEDFEMIYTSYQNVYNFIDLGYKVYFINTGQYSMDNNVEMQKIINKKSKNFNYFTSLIKLENVIAILHTSPIQWNHLINTYSKYVKSYKIIIGKYICHYDKIPDNEVQLINNSCVNKIIVPSEFCKNTLINSGVTKLIEVKKDSIILNSKENYTIDELCKNSFSLSPNNEEIKLNERYKYLNISSFSNRENVLSIIKSYLDAFKFEDDTVLILKLIYVKDKENIINTIRSYVNSRIMYDQEFRFAPIIIDFENFSIDQINSLCKNIDCYINTSYGEGFSMFTYRAFNNKKVIISPNTYGVKEYLNNYDNLYPLEYKVSSILYTNQSNNMLNYSMNCIKIYDDGLTVKLKEVLKNEVFNRKYNIYQYKLNENINSIFNCTSKTTKFNIPILTNLIDNTNFNDCVISNLFGFYFNLNYIPSNEYTIELGFSILEDNTFIIINNKSKKLNIGNYKIKLYLTNKDKDLTIKFNGIENKFLGKLKYICGYDLDNNYYNFYTNKEDYQNFRLPENKIENNNVIFKGDYGEFFIQLNNDNNESEYPRKIFLGNQISFYSHRSGWDYVLHNMRCLHSNSGVYFDGFLENNFAWRREESIYTKKIPYKTPWVGFMHNPPNQPPWFSDNNAFCNSLLTDNIFKESLKYCKGLFTLSKYHADFIKQYVSINLPVISLYHPTEIPENQFDFNKFRENKEKKIINIGYWLRRLNNIYYLIVPEKYTKIRLMPGDKSYETIKRLEKVEHIITQRHPTEYERQSVIEMQHLTNDEYDKLLSENLVYLNLYDSSANNAIIECIARATPIIVNRHPAIIEYLGEDYPLYIDNNQDNVVQLLTDDNIEYAHLYLKEIQYKVNIKTFLDDFTDNVIYKSL